MIRVTIEMLPRGDEKRARTLHVIEIWNDLRESLSTEGRRGTYKYRISRKLGPHNPNRKGAMRWQHDGEIHGFPRASKNAVHLLRNVLNEAYYGAEDSDVPVERQTRSTEAVYAEEREAPIRTDPANYPDEGAYRAMRDPAYQDDPLPDDHNYALQYQRKGR